MDRGLTKEAAAAEGRVAQAQFRQEYGGGTVDVTAMGFDQRDFTLAGESMDFLQNNRGWSWQNDANWNPALRPNPASAFAMNYANPFLNPMLGVAGVSQYYQNAGTMLAESRLNFDYAYDSNMSEIRPLTQRAIDNTKAWYDSGLYQLNDPYYIRQNAIQNLMIVGAVATTVAMPLAAAVVGRNAASLAAGAINMGTYVGFSEEPTVVGAALNFAGGYGMFKAAGAIGTSARLSTKIGRQFAYGAGAGFGIDYIAQVGTNAFNPNVSGAYNTLLGDVNMFQLTANTLGTSFGAGLTPVFSVSEMKYQPHMSKGMSILVNEWIPGLSITGSFNMWGGGMGYWWDANKRNR